MQISFTGTFKVPRKKLEDVLIVAGHKIVPLGKKTEVFLVGERTASPEKVEQAERAGIRIIRETVPDKILAELGSDAAGKGKTRFFAKFYGNPKGVVKIFATSEEEAMKKIFKKFPQHARTEGEDIEYVLSEAEFNDLGETEKFSSIVID